MKIMRIIKKVATAVKNWVNTTFFVKKQKYIQYNRTTHNSGEDTINTVHDETIKSDADEANDKSIEHESIGTETIKDETSAIPDEESARDSDNKYEPIENNDDTNTKEEQTLNSGLCDDELAQSISDAEIIDDIESETESSSFGSRIIKFNLGKELVDAANSIPEVGKFDFLDVLFESCYSEYEKLYNESREFTCGADELLTIVYNDYKDFEDTSRLIFDENDNFDHLSRRDHVGMGIIRSICFPEH